MILNSWEIWEKIFTDNNAFTNLVYTAYNWWYTCSFENERILYTVENMIIWINTVLKNLNSQNDGNQTENHGTNDVMAGH